VEKLVRLLLVSPVYIRPLKLNAVSALFISAESWLRSTMTHAINNI
jgi:hypothetical protein